MDALEVRETVRAGRHYLEQLKSLNEEITNALSQITNTSKEAESSIINKFSLLESRIMKLIQEKKMELLDKISKVKDRHSKPLFECESLIKSKIQETEELLEIGDDIQAKNINIDKMENFVQRSSLLGSLPEVPTLKEVPCIFFEYDQMLEDELLEIIARNGKVTRIAPVQICQMLEKPGSILVEWHTVDLEDKSPDIQEFCLQKAHGDFSTSQLKFETCYKGPETQFLVRNLSVDEVYSFRIGCKFEGTSNYSRWSVPQKHRTRLKTFCWKKNRECFLMNSECQIAEPIVNSPELLISDGPQFKVGHSVEFLVLEMDANTVAYLGMIADDKTEKLSTLSNCDGTFILSSIGEITVDGVKKSTQLPAFQTGTQVTFNCEIALNDRIVIHIDSNDKRVTYEWYIDRGQCFYFAAELPTKKWKIMVE